jgi:chloramphenicol-sensitive protein RarD
MSTGAWYALGAYGIWGIFPIYWKLLAEVHYLQIMAHRISWSALFLSLLLLFRPGWKAIKNTLVEKRMLILKVFLPSALLVGFNWTLYIYCMANNHVLESSLGYFMNPLVNVFLGWILLSEKLTKIQWWSVFSAAVGVGVMVFAFGRPPYFALLLAFSFSIYGLIRKNASAHFTSVFGTAIECILMLPLALYFMSQSENRYELGANATSALLVFAGLVTALPLVWFAEAAKRLPYSTIGFFQFLAPTIQFFCAIFLFKESMSESKLLGFLFIWLGAILFVFDKLRLMRKSRKLKVVG